MVKQLTWSQKRRPSQSMKIIQSHLKLLTMTAGGLSKILRYIGSVEQMNYSRWRGHFGKSCIMH